MKRHSILTSVFPQIGFHHYTLKELYERDQENLDSSFLGVAWNDSLGLHDDFLPQVRYGNAVISTDLWCKELTKSQSDRILRPSRGGETSSLAAAFIFVYDSDQQKEVGITALKRSLNSDKPGNYRFTLLICLDNIFKQLDQNSSSDPDSTLDLLCQRKVLFAKELTTIYRNYVNCWLYLNGVESEIPPIGYRSKLNRTGKSSDNGHHPSDEGGWRLVCGFSSIWTALKRFCYFPEFRNLHTVADYLEFKENYPGHYQKYLSYIALTERIPPYIAEKKTFEYFIYKSL